MAIIDIFESCWRLLRLKIVKSPGLLHVSIAAGGLVPREGRREADRICHVAFPGITNGAT